MNIFKINSIVNFERVNVGWEAQCYRRIRSYRNCKPIDCFLFLEWVTEMYLGSCKKNYNGVFLQKYLTAKSRYFRKKFPSQMFDKVLNKSLE